MARWPQQLLVLSFPVLTACSPPARPGTPTSPVVTPGEALSGEPGEGAIALISDQTVEHIHPLRADYEHRPCTAKGWCWVHPNPLGTHVLDVAGTSENNVYAVAEGGIIIRLHGKRWHYEWKDPRVELHAVWLSPDGDIFAGGNVILQAGRDGVWATTHRFVDGVVNDIWGIDSNSVYAVGTNGIHAFDGSSWSPVKLPAVEPRLRSIWGSAQDNIWVVGRDGTALRSREVIFHFDGIKWKSVATPVGLQRIGALWGMESDTYLAGTNEQGRTAIWRRSGNKWVGEKVPVSASKSYVMSASDAGFLARRNPEQTGNLMLFNWSEIILLQRQGDSWNERYLTRASHLYVLPDWSAWSAPTGGTFIVGEWGHLGSFDGERWESYDSATPGMTLMDIWGSEAELWAVGTAGTILEYDGAVWSESESGTRKNLNAVTGNGSAVAAVGEFGTFRLNTGSGWRELPTGTELTLHDVAPVGDSDFVAVPERGFLLFCTTEHCTQRKVPIQEILLSVFVRGSRELYVGTTNGEIWRSVGDSWRRIRLGESEPVTAIASLDDDWVLASAGTRSVKLHRDGSWSFIALPDGFSSPPARLYSNQAEEICGLVENTQLCFDSTHWRAEDLGIKDGTIDRELVLNTGWAGPKWTTLVGIGGTILQKLKEQPHGD